MRGYQVLVLILIIWLFIMGRHAEAATADLWFYSNLDMDLLLYLDTGYGCVPVENTSWF